MAFCRDIKIGVSSCLVGENVRYDAKNKINQRLIDKLGGLVELVPVCPETGCGLGTPREPMYLKADSGTKRLVTKNSGIDHTDKMLEWSKRKIQELEELGIAGFVFKNNSPSCGLHSVFSEQGMGLFSEEVMKHFKHMPVEDEEGLSSRRAIAEFIKKALDFKNKGLYIHVPFCRKKCLYCDFYSALYDKAVADSYISVVLEQISKLDFGFSSVYIGGGTPSILDADIWIKLLKGIKRFLKKDLEFTIEANPESLDKEKLELFIGSGVNRISIGAQSFNDKKLRSLGRIHTAEDAFKAIGLAKEAGFKNISIDMMFGGSGEDLTAWQADLEKAVGSGPQHISCYSLSYEKGTPFFRMRERREIEPVDEKIAADMYIYTTGFLAKNGLERYEVSNFARPGFECAHNLAYWNNSSYIGIGPSAVSYAEGARSENIKDIEEYIDRYRKGVALVSYKERLSDLKAAKETAALKIRTREGIGYKWFKCRTGFDFEDIENDSLEELFKDNLLERKIDRITGERTGLKLTERGFLFADTVSAGFL